MAHLADVLRALAGTELKEEDGKQYRLELMPPATSAQLCELAERTGAEIPAEIAQGLAVASGFENGPLDGLSLLGVTDFEFEGAFERPHPIGADGFGNFWVVDIDAAGWGPVYFVCHDPPVIAYQSPDVAQFLRDVVALDQAGARSPVDLVHEDVVSRLWSARKQAQNSADDAAISEFVLGLPEGALLEDLRPLGVGKGFAWGTFGPQTEIRRCGSLPVWAIIPPKETPGFLARLFS